MCGISGIFDPRVEADSYRTLMKEMLRLIEHRGPDESTIYCNRNVCLGHQRLSIIDLVSGSQPIFNEKHTVCVIFNGEIYNFKEIRQDLENKGHVFSTNTDTEVLVHSYEEYNYDFFPRLKGIFAFAIYDLLEEKIILVRDHFGVKPLHYYFKEGLFIFSSEQKAILLHEKVERKINLNSLHSHLNLRYTQREGTLFEGIKRIPPAHYLTFQNNSIQLRRYWQLRSEVNFSLKEEDAIEQIHHYIKQAVHRQLMSDVPLGVYLSGGLDSSTIVQKMYELSVPEINTFTLGFNEPTDEFPDADMIAKHFGTTHHTLSLKMDPLQHMPEVIWHAEEPKINLLQGFNMSKFVNQHVKVVLGGLGGDELFAGYDIHKFIYPFNKIHTKVPKFLQKMLEWKSCFLFKIQNASKTLGIDEYRRGLQMLTAIGNIEKFYLIIRNVWDYDPGFYSKIYHPSIAGKMKNEIDKTGKEFLKYFVNSTDLSALDQVLYTEFHSKMINDYLLVEDRMSMANSVEERVPFLDIDLVNFGFSIPISMKIKHNKTKYLFRKAMQTKLPAKIIKKKKWGFTVNPYLQFKKDLKITCEKILTKEFIEKQGIFNYNYIKQILDYHPSPRLRWHYNFIWIVMGLAIWQKMFIETNNFQKKEFRLDEYFNI